MRLLPRTLTLALALAAAPLVAPLSAQGVRTAPEPTAPTAADSAAIRAAALDYIDGWYGGNAERMTRALHPSLAKRIVRGSQVDHMGADTLIAYTGRGGGNRTPENLRRNDVRILDVFGNAASVRVDATNWIDYLHLGKVNGQWKIVNVLWEMRPRG